MALSNRLSAFLLLLAACVATSSGGASIDDFELRQRRVLAGVSDSVLVGVPDVGACAASCDGDLRCRSFTFVRSSMTCELRSGEEFVEGEYAGYVSGISRPIRRYVTLEAKGTDGSFLDAALRVQDANECALRCDERGSECRSFTYDTDAGTCWLLDGASIKSASEPSSYLTGLKL